MFRQVVGPELELRLFEQQHAEILFALTNRNREHLRKWLPWVDGANFVADTRRFIASSLERFARNEGFAAGVWVRGSLAGAIDLHEIHWDNRAASIGYWLSADHEGQGIMTAACRAVLDYAFGELRLHRVEIRCGAGNHKSCAIPERLGFQKEGLLRQAEWVSGRFVDLYVYAMLGQDWEAGRNSRSAAELG